MLTEEQINAINKDIPYDEGKICTIADVPYALDFLLKNHIDNDIILYKKEICYQYSGGSCWGHEVTYSEGEEVEFYALDGALSVLWPSITYLQYKKLLKLLNIQEEHDDVTGYYGNSTCYKYEYVMLKDLVETIEKLKE